MNKKPKEKILLSLLPYWTPQIPPVGIACLRGFLREHGYEVSTVDVNVEGEARNIYDKYFDALRGYVSENKRGNFYNIGHEVMQNQMMAHINYSDENEYIELVKDLIYKTFYFSASTAQVKALNVIVDEFYQFLEAYFIDVLEREKPGVLGLSVYKGNLPAALYVFRLTRKLHPGIKTVMGGAVFAQLLNPGTPNFDHFLEQTEGVIDHLVVGEGENLFLKLLEGELPAAQRVFTLKDIDNKTLELRDASLPDFTGLNISVYPNMASYTSRSCPFQCKFCTETVYWGKYRKKKAEQIVRELASLYEAYGIKLFLLSDSLLNPVITDLAGEFQVRDFQVYWDGYLRVTGETCDREKAYHWRKGGFYRARLGVESGSQRVLDAMDKPIPIENIKTTLFNLSNAGIKTTCYFIMGYPGETEEDFQATLDFVAEFKDEIYEAECNPFGYYPDAQADSEGFQKEKKSIPLYPGARDMLMLQTWGLDCEPRRAIVYQRVSRFVKHCYRLGIPNPYSLYDIHMADDRWKKLHRNAVPSLVEFRSSGDELNDVNKVEELCILENKFEGAEDFDF